MTRKQKDCVEGKIRNPATGRCVLKTGVIGRRVLVSSKSYKNSALRKKIASSKWFIITTPGCGYCTETKKLLRRNGQKFHYRSLTVRNKDSIFAVTHPMTKNYEYFPMIFHQGKFYGGFQELSKHFAKR